jgi:hypothetical protein
MGAEAGYTQASAQGLRVIPYGQELIDLVEEIAEWSLSDRRAYLEVVEKNFGTEDANRLKQSLKDFWAGKGK